MFCYLFLFLFTDLFNRLFCPKKKEEPERQSGRAAEQKLLQRSHKRGLMKEKKSVVGFFFVLWEIVKLCSSSVVLS